MGGAIVTEGIFNIHGVGGVLYQAVTRQEAPTVVSIVTVLVLIYLITNLMVDLLYAALDPGSVMAEPTRQRGAAFGARLGVSCTDARSSSSPPC